MSCLLNKRLEEFTLRNDCLDFASVAFVADNSGITKMADDQEKVVEGRENLETGSEMEQEEDSRKPADANRRGY